jgi:hypothetical protein
MSDPIERLAYFSVGRAVGFASIAVVMFFLAMSHDLAAALRCAGILGLVITCVLILKGRSAPTRSYKQTEVWVLLKPLERPGPAVAQRVISAALEEAYAYFAMQAAVFAALSLCAALVVGLVRTLT